MGGFMCSVGGVVRSSKMELGRERKFVGGSCSNDLGADEVCSEGLAVVGASFGGRRSDTAVLASLCKNLMVATGRAAVFVLRAKSQTIKAWDHAVGMICVHEAGGKVTDWEGSEIDLSADKAGRRVIVPSGGVLATNGSLHNQIIEMTSSNSSHF